MQWYYYPAAGLLLLLPAAVAVMLLPLRIFVHYLRENKIDRLTLTVKLARVGLRLLAYREDERELTLSVLLGRRAFRLPVLRKKSAGRDTIAIKLGLWELKVPLQQGLPGWNDLNRGREMLKAIRPLLKKLSWRRFDLEVIFGLDEAAATGITAGSGWAAGGIILGFLHHYFSVDTVPRLKLVPQFAGPGMRLCWEGELAMPLFRWMKLWLITRKVGGAASG